MNYLNGYKIVQDPNMTEPGEPFEMKRSLRSRLFTLPWRPFKKTLTVQTVIPSKQAIINENERWIVMHPAMARKLQESI